MVPDYRLLEGDSSVFAHQFHTSMVGERKFDSIADRRASLVTGAWRRDARQYGVD
jgi:hypothetical protein